MRKVLPGFWGIFPMAFYGIHASYWIARGEPSNLLWLCHLGALLCGLGILLHFSRLLLVGVMWLVVGNFFWLLYLATGGEFIFSSLLTHMGGLLFGLVALKKTGVRPHTWLLSVGLFGILWLLTRWMTNPTENVNLAFSIHPGWDQYFSHFFIYILFLAICCSLAFYLLEKILIQVFKVNP